MTDLHHPDGTPLTDEEFRKAADHTWLNAMSCVRPTDEFAAQVGHEVIAALKATQFRTAPIVPGETAGMSRAAVIWFNMS